MERAQLVFDYSGQHGPKGEPFLDGESRSTDQETTRKVFDPLLGLPGDKVFYHKVPNLKRGAGRNSVRVPTYVASERPRRQSGDSPGRDPYAEKVSTTVFAPRETIASATPSLPNSKSTPSIPTTMLSERAPANASSLQHIRKSVVSRSSTFQSRSSRVTGLTDASADPLRGFASGWKRGEEVEAEDPGKGKLMSRLTSATTTADNSALASPAGTERREGARKGRASKKASPWDQAGRLRKEDTLRNLAQGPAEDPSGLPIVDFVISGHVDDPKPPALSSEPSGPDSHELLAKLPSLVPPHDVSFRADQQTAHMELGKVHHFADYKIPPSKVVFADIPTSIGPLMQDFDREKIGGAVLSPSIMQEKETRDWYMQTFPDRNLAGRQDVKMLVVWLQKEMAAAVERADGRAKGPPRDHNQEGRNDYDFLDEQQHIFCTCAYELCRQVSTHCVERGRLLAYLWHSVSIVIEKMLAENRVLQEENLSVEALKESLQQRFDSASAAVKQKQDDMEREFQLMRDRYSRQAVELAALNLEVAELREWKIEHEAKPEIQQQLNEANDKISIITKEAQEAKAEKAHMLEVVSSNQKKLDQVEARAAEQTHEIFRLRQAALTLTPRLDRQFDVPAADLITVEQRALVDSMLNHSIAPAAILKLMRRTDLLEYTTRFFGLCHEHMNAEHFSMKEFMRLIKAGDLSTLDKFIDAKSAMAVGSMLHHGLRVADVQLVLFGLDAQGHDVIHYKDIIGCLPEDKATDEQAMAMLDRAAQSNRSRFDELLRELKRLQGLLQNVEAKEKTEMMRRRVEEERAEKIKNQQKKNKNKSYVDRFFEVEWKDMFIGIGMGPEVPKFLRTNGRVRNRSLSKRDTEKLVKEVWAEKALYDQGRSEPSKLAEFVYVHLQKKVGIQNAIVEWGYNFLWGLHKYSQDPDCDLFLHILLGEVSEDVYKDQLKLQNDIIEMFGQVDAAGHATKTNSISKEEAKAAVAAFFQGKKQERIDKIVEALDADEPSDHIDYRRLFEEDREFNQGEFAEEVLGQQLQERVEYLREVEEAMYFVGTEGAGDEFTVNPKQVEQALLRVEPLMARETCRMYLARCFQGKETNESEQLDIPTVIGRFKQGVVRKNLQALVSKAFMPGNKLLNVFAAAKKKAQSTVENRDIERAIQAVRELWIRKEVGVSPSGETPKMSMFERSKPNMFSNEGKGDSDASDSEEPKGASFKLKLASLRKSTM